MPEPVAHIHMIENLSDMENSILVEDLTRPKKQKKKVSFLDEKFRECIASRIIEE